MWSEGAGGFATTCSNPNLNPNPNPYPNPNPNPNPDPNPDPDQRVGLTHGLLGLSVTKRLKQG